LSTTESTTITLDQPLSLSKWITMVALLLAILAVVLVSATAQVRRCEVIPGAFGSDFGSDFEVRRTVCDDVSLARVVFDDLRSYVRARLAALGSRQTS
jgi:hypothetical protein